jgi:hypothetical protein
MGIQNAYQDACEKPDAWEADFVLECLRDWADSLSAMQAPAFSALGAEERSSYYATSNAACVLAGLWDSGGYFSSAAKGAAARADALRGARRLAELSAGDPLLAKRALEKEGPLHLAAMESLEAGRAAPTLVLGDPAALSLGGDKAADAAWDKLVADPWYADYYHPFRLSAAVKRNFASWRKGKALSDPLRASVRIMGYMRESLGFKGLYDWSEDPGKETKFGQGAAYLCREFERQGRCDGDCVSGSLLLAALLREAGFRSCLARVPRVEDGTFQQDHYCVAVEGRAGQLFVDNGLLIAGFLPVEARLLSDAEAVYENLRYSEKAQYEGPQGAHDLMRKFDMLLSGLPGNADILYSAVDDVIGRPAGPERDEWLAGLLPLCESLRSARGSGPLIALLSEAKILNALERYREAADLADRALGGGAMGCWQLLKCRSVSLEMLGRKAEAALCERRALRANNLLSPDAAYLSLARIAKLLGGDGAEADPEAALAAWKSAADLGYANCAYSSALDRLIKYADSGEIEFEVNFSPEELALFGGRGSLGLPPGCAFIFGAGGALESVKVPRPADFTRDGRTYMLAAGSVAKLSAKGEDILSGWLREEYPLPSDFGPLAFMSFGSGDELKVFGFCADSSGESAFISPASSLRVAGTEIPLESGVQANLNARYMDGVVHLKLAGDIRIAAYGGTFAVDSGALAQCSGKYLHLKLDPATRLSYRGRDLPVMIGKQTLDCCFSGDSVQARLERDAPLPFEGFGVSARARNSSEFDIMADGNYLYFYPASPIGLPGGIVIPTSVPHPTWIARLGDDGIKAFADESRELRLGTFRGKADGGGGSGYPLEIDPRGRLASLRTATPFAIFRGAEKIECPALSVLRFGADGLPVSVRTPVPVPNSVLPEGCAAFGIDPSGRVVSMDSGRPAELSVASGRLEGSPGGCLAFDSRGALSGFSPESGGKLRIGSSVLAFSDAVASDNGRVLVPVRNGKTRIALSASGLSLTLLLSEDATIDLPQGSLPVQANLFSICENGMLGFLSRGAVSLGVDGLYSAEFAKAPNEGYYDFLLTFDGIVAGYPAGKSACGYSSLPDENAFALLAGPNLILGYRDRAAASLPLETEVLMKGLGMRRTAEEDNSLADASFRFRGADIRVPSSSRSYAPEAGAAPRRLLGFRLVEGLELQGGFPSLPRSAWLSLFPDGSLAAVEFPDGSALCLDRDGRIATELPPRTDFGGSNAVSYCLWFASGLSLGAAAYEFGEAVPLIARLDAAGNANALFFLDSPRPLKSGGDMEMTAGKWLEIR